MNPHVTATIAGVLAAVLSVGAAQLIRPPQIVAANNPAPIPDGTRTPTRGSLSFGEAAPPPPSAAKTRFLASTTWPEMEQREVDALTEAARPIGGTVLIFCHEEAKCGDLALSLDNAFESARWASKVQMFPNLPPGIAASTPELAAMLNAATGGRFDVGVDPQRSAPGDYVAIGRREASR